MLPPFLKLRKGILTKKKRSYKKKGIDTQMKKVVSAVTRLFSIVLIVVLLVALFLNLSTMWSIERIEDGKYITKGYISAIIGSGSMKPTLSVNDMLIAKGDTAYQVGDIVIYVSTHGNLITHRVVDVLGDGYITQGDANNTPDAEISNQRLLGKVVLVLPGVGGIIYGILSPVGIVLLGSICVLLLLIQKIRKNQSEEEDDDDTENYKENTGI